MNSRQSLNQFDLNTSIDLKGLSDDKPAFLNNRPMDIEKNSSQIKSSNFATSEIKNKSPEIHLKRYSGKPALFPNKSMDIEKNSSEIKSPEFATKIRSPKSRGSRILPELLNDEQGYFKKKKSTPKIERKTLGYLISEARNISKYTDLSSEFKNHFTKDKINEIINKYKKLRLVIYSLEKLKVFDSKNLEYEKRKLASALTNTMKDNDDDGDSEEEIRRNNKCIMIFIFSMIFVMAVVVVVFFILWDYIKGEK